MSNLVSVVIPVYNGQEYVQESIGSVLKQDYDEVEVIIVDDCSSDRTPEIVQEYIKKNKDKNKTIKYFKNDINKGIGYSRNKGVKKSKGYYVMFLSHDDLMLPNSITEFVKSHDEFNGITFSDYILINDKGEETGIYKAPDFDSLENFRISVLSNAYKNTMFVNYSCIIAKRDLFINIPFDDGLRFGEDLDHLLRACLLFNVDMGHLQEPLIKYRLHNKNTTTNQFKNIPANNVKILRRLENAIESRDKRKYTSS